VHFYPELHYKYEDKRDKGSDTNPGEKMESECERGMTSAACRRWGSPIGGGWQGDRGIWLAAADGFEADVVGADGKSITMLASAALRILPWNDNHVVSSSNDGEMVARNGDEMPIAARNATYDDGYSHEASFLLLLFLIFFVIFVWVPSMIEFGF